MFEVIWKLIDLVFVVQTEPIRGGKRGGSEFAILGIGYSRININLRVNTALLK